MRLRSLQFVIAVAIAAIAPARAADPTIDQDLEALKGKWVSPEITFKRGRTTVTVRFTADFRGKGEGVWADKQSYTPPADVGAGLLTAGGVESGFKYAIEEKEGKRYLRLHGPAFLRPSEQGKGPKEFPVVTTYRLGGDRLELGTGEVRAWVVAAALDPPEVVSLKGVWTRVKGHP